MVDNIWPGVSDVRLLRVLEKQVSGALQDLHDCTEDGLGHLASVLEHHPDSVVTPHIMKALTDLQKIDRVAQRLRNVAHNLSEWADFTPEKPRERPTWAEAVSSRFVMPEESSALKQVLGDE